MSRAVIITSYLEYPLDISALLRPDDTIVCLDGGFDIAKEHGLDPDILLGDFDSIDANIEEIRVESSGSDDEADNLRIVEYPPEKDYTDLELALKLLDPGEFPELLIIGGIGGRLDQTAVNLQLIARYTSGYASPGQGFDLIEMLDGRNRCFAVRGSEKDYFTIPAQEGSYLSLLPMSETCEGVSLTGVKYPLEKATLRRAASLGISNEIIDDRAELTAAEGTMLVICSRE